MDEKYDEEETMSTIVEEACNLPYMDNVLAMARRIASSSPSLSDLNKKQLEQIASNSYNSKSYRRLKQSRELSGY